MDRIKFIIIIIIEILLFQINQLISDTNYIVYVNIIITIFIYLRETKSVYNKEDWKEQIIRFSYIIIWIILGYDKYSIYFNLWYYLPTITFIITSILKTDFMKENMYNGIISIIIINLCINLLIFGLRYIICKVFCDSTFIQYLNNIFIRNRIRVSSNVSM